VKYSDSANCAQGVDNLFVLTVYQLYKGPYSYLFAVSLFYQTMPVLLQLAMSYLQ